MSVAAPAVTVGGGSSVLDPVDEVLGRRVSLRSLALLRILVGPVVLLHLWPFVSDALDGRIYRDQFSEPYAAWYPELPRALYSGLLYLGVVAAVALSLGIATRVASVVTFGVVAYNLFLSTTNVHNNRAFLVIVLAGLAVAPCGRELSVDAWWRRRRGRPPLDPRAPAWPLWLLRFEASVLYGASGLSKLLDPDWFGGTVTWHRVTQHRADMLASPLPGWAIDLLLDRSFHTVAAKVIVLTELAIATGLWSRRTRYAAVWLAVCFHVAIQLTASVEVFSYLAIAALVIWAVPSTGDRVLALDRSAPAHRRLARTVGALDWLARFRIVDRPGSDVALVDRDGTTFTGRSAVAHVYSRLPLTAWPALPTLLLPPLRHPAAPTTPPTGPADLRTPADASDLPPPSAPADAADAAHLADQGTPADAAGLAVPVDAPAASGLADPADVAGMAEPRDLAGPGGAADVAGPVGPDDRAGLVDVDDEVGRALQVDAVGDTAPGAPEDVADAVDGAGLAELGDVAESEDAGDAVGGAGVADARGPVEHGGDRRRGDGERAGSGRGDGEGGRAGSGQGMGRRDGEGGRAGTGLGEGRSDGAGRGAG